MSCWTVSIWAWAPCCSLQSDERLRDRMVDSIMPTWDGNETWLIMAGVALLAAFPIAYGVLLPAFYIPLIVMLLALGLRGVSFEFRYQTEKGRRFWDAHSVSARSWRRSCRGLSSAGSSRGSRRWRRFGGSVFDVFQPFPAADRVSVLAGYVVLGGGWLHLKATATLREFAERSLRRRCPSSSPRRRDLRRRGVGSTRHSAAWAAHPIALALIRSLFLDRASPFCARSATLATDVRSFWPGAVRARCRRPWIHIFPDIVPFRLTLWPPHREPSAMSSC